MGSSVPLLYIAGIKAEKPAWKKVGLGGISSDNSIKIACYESRGKRLWLVDDVWNIYLKESIDSDETFELINSFDNVLIAKKDSFFSGFFPLGTENKNFFMPREKR